MRPYTASDGRTRPATRLDLMTLVRATGRPARGAPPGPEHGQVLALTRAPISVAELAAHLRLPAAVTKVLLGDLLACGAVTVNAPEPTGASPTDRDLLEAVLRGLRERL
ncbi:DUF742 domain-containing protein [Streptomyces sp. 3MP-14]|uniref:DUF742 domain-containing protein n=1 Tax=Streptomyces mimosae TaxID=2586635 RepID=A0A5N6AEC4_9ACTN|nr:MULTISPECIES: DUF742 domain-containing protein [Streptomyces]KAB8166565.1 DUF742 domain-containing protein [Streptomyces mimosae]KAB8179257.1 DUF742 domain-containing protein [Streptomyces sp. 3MP-14]